MVLQRKRSLGRTGHMIIKIILFKLDPLSDVPPVFVRHRPFPRQATNRWLASNQTGILTQRSAENVPLSQGVDVARTD